MRKKGRLLALVLAIMGTLLVIYSASQQEICSPAGTGCTSVNYAPGYLGMAVLAAAVEVTFGSSRFRPSATPTKPD